MSENPQETFLEECNELLQDMEEALLTLENDASDPELINSLFRCAHTIKGTSGVFSFEDVEAFTHVVENVLERLRSEEIQIDSNLIAVLLECNDHIGTLVDLAVKEESLTDELSEKGQELLESLAPYVDETKSSVETKEVVPHTGTVETVSQGRPVETDNWHISLRFNNDVLKNGMDPLSFIRYLQKLGDIVHITTLCDALPDISDMDAEDNYLGFEIDFSSSAEKADIEQVFEFVRDDCQLSILPPKANIEIYANLMNELPEDDMRVGEILLKSGALTAHELDDALKIQQGVHPESLAAPMIGDVLLQQNVVHKEIVDVALKKQQQNKEKKLLGGGSRSLRVDSEKLDNLINLVGELVIAESGARMRAKYLEDGKLLESLALMNRLVEEIRDNSLRLRMVQIGETFNRFQRVVRDVSRELNKDIRLEINGSETELDKTVVEKIADPLMHLVRNAMDHGIESAEERAAKGKSAQGILELNAYHDSGNIVIEVSDNGKGLDPEVIQRKAIEKGLISKEAILSEQEIFMLIFEPGFSTAEQVTNLSGRGVGMDVVKKNIQALRGSVDIQSEKHKGSTIRIRLPLTLAIIDGFLIRVGASSYVVPLDMVVECIDLDEDDNKNKDKGYINLRGEVLPFARLSDVFDVDCDTNHAHEAIVVVQYGGYKAGFVVDELLGEFQTVIKPLGKLFQNLKGISGATILGSGEVAVILDVPSLLQHVIQYNQIAHISQNNNSDNHVLH